MKNSPDQDLPEILVRKKKDETDVFIIIIGGLFNTNKEGLNIEARFDDGKIYNYWCNSNDSNRYELVIQNKLEFISQLKNSKKVIIKAEFYDNGVHEMAFVSEENLQWN